MQYLQSYSTGGVHRLIFPYRIQQIRTPTTLIFMTNWRRHQCHSKAFFKLGIQAKFWSSHCCIAFYLNILLFYIIFFHSQNLSIVSKLKYLHLNNVQKTDHVHIVTKPYIEIQYIEQQACQTCGPQTTSMSAEHVPQCILGAVVCYTSVSSW